MGVLSNLFSFASFVSGTVFGALMCLAVIFHLLRSGDGSKGKDGSDGSSSSSKKLKRNSLPSPSKSDQSKSSIESVMSPEDAIEVKRLITFLEEFNSPLKNIGGQIMQMYKQREQGAKVRSELLEKSPNHVIDISTVTRMEKDLYESIGKLKEHGKTMKGFSNFLGDLGKAYSSFAKDLNKLSNQAKNNMFKGLRDLNIDTKEELIINNWWQAMQISLSYMASDQEAIASQISENILNFFYQMNEELGVFEKRFTTEGAKQVQNIKEQLSAYESKRKERDKYKEKVRLQGSTSTLSTQTPAEIASRRALKMKINDETLQLQFNKLLSVQKEFYNLMPRIDADIQLTVLKSIVDTHSQLLKIADSLEKNQESNKMVTKRMKLQLTNAASSLMQMIKEEGELLASDTSNTSMNGFNSNNSNKSNAGVGDHWNPSAPEIIAYEESLRTKMLESGVQGYELSLQKVLEGLLQHCQHCDFNIRGNSTVAVSTSTTTGGATGQQQSVSGNGTGNGSAEENSQEVSMESLGLLNMTKESTACLAASNPGILPLLPSRFGTAVGYETCVWFNSFSGRVYRDISNSNYFYNWFCRKLTYLLNKGTRPDYVDEFKVEDVKFGELPPLLLNVQWNPPCKQGPFSAQPGLHDPDYSDKAAGRSSPDSKAQSSVPNRDFIYEQSDSDSDDSDSKGAQSTQKQRQRKKGPPPKMSDSEYFAACTADLAFRSGIQFTVSTKLWINWPRDRYASVPVLVHLDLAELSGRIRFGVTRGYSFFSFIGDPLMRINVRNEVGKGAYKLKDFPQLSEFIVKKLKAYVHNRIVHPHSHKFRLIWPRNWWPEGTENDFLGEGEQQNQKTGAPSSSTVDSVRKVDASVGTEDSSSSPQAVLTARTNIPIQTHSTMSVSNPDMALYTQVPTGSSVNLTEDSPSSKKIVSTVRGDSVPAAGTGSNLSTELVNNNPTEGKGADTNTNNNTNASTTSSYQSMKSKVTQWMQSGSRRNSAANANDDHFHPLSRAAQQSKQPEELNGVPLQLSVPAGSQGAEGFPVVTRSRRPSAADTAKELAVSTIGKSNIFKMLLSSSNAQDNNQMLPFLSSQQREVFNDNLAWDIMIRNLVLKFEAERSKVPKIVYDDSPGDNSPPSHNAEANDTSESAEKTTKIVVFNPFIQRPREHSWEQIQLSPVAFQIASSRLSAHCTETQRCLEKGLLSGGSSSNGNPMRSRAESFSSLVNLQKPASVSDTPKEKIGMSKCKSFEQHDLSLLLDSTQNPLIDNRPNPKSVMDREPQGASIDPPLRLRSYSIDDFRSEILDAMFRLRLLDQNSNASKASFASTNTGGKLSTHNKQQSVSIESFNESSKPIDNHDQIMKRTSTQSSGVAGNSHVNSSKSPFSTPSESRNRSSSVHGVDLKAKFAEFKAKHLNNKDIVDVLKLRPTAHSDGRNAMDDSSHGDSSHLNMRDALFSKEDDVIFTHSLSPLPAMVNSPSGSSISGRSRSVDVTPTLNSTSAGGAGGGTSNSSSALRYVSNMFRSKFQGNGSNSGGADGK